MKVTIKDVAKLAQVSQSTVSRVLHDNPKISEETKNKVKRAMRDLGYLNSSPIYHYVSNTTRTIALLLRDQPEDITANPFSFQLMQGASQYARQLNYHVLYAFYKDNEDEIKFINEYIQSRLVKGLILVLSLKNDFGIEYMLKKEYPFVVIGRPPDLQNTYWVDNDNFQAVYDSVNFLIRKGKTKIAYISAPIDFTALQYRFNGYQQALQNYQIQVKEELIAFGRDDTEKSGYECMFNMLKQHKPDAVITSDDVIAFGVMKALAEQKMKKVSVIGFNNSTRGLFEKPTLSSVDINPHQLGSQAARLLINQIENIHCHEKHQIVDTQLIERETT